MSRMSFAESLFPTCPFVQSRHSVRKSVPGSVTAAAGMSGCQRLCPGTSWSAIDLPSSTLKRGSGITPPHLKYDSLLGACDTSYLSPSSIPCCSPSPAQRFPHSTYLSITECETSRQMGIAVKIAAEGSRDRQRRKG